MEDVYTVKVKTKPDTRNLYPSERRYSASTVSGLAWVHIALAATSFLLACLALVNPNADIKRLKLNDTEETVVGRSELTFNLPEFDTSTDNIEITTEFSNLEAQNETDSEEVKANEGDLDRNANRHKDNNYILVLAPTMLTVFALAAGLAAVMASVRWYIDRNITWLFFVSIISTVFAFISLVMVIAWLAATEANIAEFYKNSLNLKDYFVVKTTDVVHKNNSHMIVKTGPKENEDDRSHLFTKRVLAINILIAAFLELLWSILSVKISYKGMRNNYKDDNDRRGNCISVVTTIKGNTNKLPRNGKLIPQKPDLIDHYPSTKIKRIFLAQGDNGFYLKNQNNKQKNTETSSEFYKERMMNFLNRCASQANNSDNRTPSEAESVLNVIPEVTNVEVTIETDPVKEKDNNRMTPVSWGDSPDHTIYNQNTLNLENIFIFKKQENGEASAQNTTEVQVESNGNIDKDVE